MTIRCLSLRPRLPECNLESWVKVEFSEMLIEELVEAGRSSKQCGKWLLKEGEVERRRVLHNQSLNVPSVTLLSCHSSIVLYSETWPHHK
jgi:hypothetical protein